MNTRLICTLILFTLLLPRVVHAVQINNGTIDFEGAHSFTVNGNRVSVDISKIVNYSSSFNSGPLRIELWSTATPYAGETPSGTLNAIIQTLQVEGIPDRLPANASFDNVVYETNYTPPAAGEFFSTLILSMNSSDCGGFENWCPIAYVNMQGNSGGTANTITQDTYTSIYGFKVLPFGDGLFSGPSETASTNGSLNSADFTTPSKFYLDVYEFTLDHEALTNITMTSNQFGTFIYIVRIDSNQNPIFYKEVKGVSNQSIFEETLPRGTYWVGTSSSFAENEGSYQLQVTTNATASLHNLDKIQTVYGIPVTINPDPQIFGALSDDDPVLNADGSLVDIYQFQVSTPTTFQFDLKSDEFDPFLVVGFVASDQSLLATYQDDDSGDSLNARLTVTLNPGTHWVAANSLLTGSKGAYSLRIRIIP